MKLILQSMFDLSGLISDRTKNFVGREWVLEEIDSWLKSENGPQFLLLTGDPGCGKTAVAARLVQISQGKAEPPIGLEKISHNFLSAVYFCPYGDPFWTDPIFFTNSLAKQLSDRFPKFKEIRDKNASIGNISIIVHQKAEKNYGHITGAIIDADAKSPLDAFIQEVRSPIELLFDNGFLGQIVVLIDGLDGAILPNGKIGIPRLLISYKHLPKGLRFIITCRPAEELMQGLKEHEPIEISLTRGTGLDKSYIDTKKLALIHLQSSLKDKMSEDTDKQAFLELISSKSKGNFLYLKYLLQMLINENGEITNKSLEDFPDGLDKIYIQFLTRLLEGERDYADKIILILWILAVAYDGLNDDQLEKITKISITNVRSILDKASHLIEHDDSNNNSFERYYRIYHRSFSELLLDRSRAKKFWCDKFKINKMIAVYYLESFSDQWHKCDRYGLSFIPKHLDIAGMRSELLALLTDRDFINARFENGMVYESAIDAANLSEGMEEAFSSFLDIFRTRDAESPSLQLRSAMNQSFGRYADWPDAIKRLLERSQDFPVMFFLANTLDMELDYPKAAKYLQTIIEKAEHNKVAAQVRLATVYSHNRDHENAIKILDSLIIHLESKKDNDIQFWWAKYQKGINLRHLRKYDEARAVLGEVLQNKATSDLKISSLHHLGVIDLEQENLECAEEKFLQCLKQRGNNQFDHRRAFEFRRLGTVYARAWISSKKFNLRKIDSNSQKYREDCRDRAKASFLESMKIAVLCGDRRYLLKAREDICKYLVRPSIEKDCPKVITTSDLKRIYNIEDENVMKLFADLREKKIDYLEIIDGDSRPTGKAATWEETHRIGLWHPSVTVVAIDKNGKIALQKRSEQDSNGKLDLSVTGHVDFGETDLLAAIRETSEELGIDFPGERFKQFKEPRYFIKKGRNDVEDSYENSRTYIYRTEKINNERISVFLIKISDEEKKRINEEKRNEITWISVQKAIEKANKGPKKFASSFKQLFSHEEIRMEFLNQIGAMD